MKEIEEEILKFFESLDRSKFVPEEYRFDADLDEPVPIGFGQTVSQPTLVAKMTSLLCPFPEGRVLEIGTGSGYQTAFLSKFFKEVFSVERIEALSEEANKRLTLLGFRNIEYLISDGKMGWKEKSPFDRIMVTAAPETIPAELVSQLKEGGKMVIPVGGQISQNLFLIEKETDRKIKIKKIFPVRFVPLV